MIELLDQVDLLWAKILAYGVFGAVLIWVWTLPTDYILQGAPDRARWRDLRWWATLLMLVMALVYAHF